MILDRRLFPAIGKSTDSGTAHPTANVPSCKNTARTTADVPSCRSTAYPISGEAGLSAEHLRAGYGKRQVLRDVSFRAEPGTLTGLLGANGCGKTTLLKVLCQQLAHSGACLFNGQPLETLPTRELARRISYIPQRSGITLSLSVLDVVLMGFNSRLRLLENPSPEHEKKALGALSLLGMESYADTDYQKLSEGQKQLCILARTIVEDASLLLLDEPESSLDFPHRHHMMRLLSSLIRASDLGTVPGREPLYDCGPEHHAGSGPKPADDRTEPETADSHTASQRCGKPKTALVTLHDPTLALEYCQNLVLLRDGVCTATLHPATDDLASMEEALSEIYGPVRLYDAGESGKRRLALLPGSR